MLNSPLATAPSRKSDGGIQGSAPSRFSGTLRLQDNCLVVASESGELMQPIFPADRANWNGSQLSFDGRTYNIGDAITLGGGALPPAFDVPQSWSVPACKGSRLFGVS